MPLLTSHEAVERPIVGIHRRVGPNDEALTSSAGFSSVADSLSEVFKSCFWMNKARFDDARVRLSQTSRLQPGWDTYGGDPPSRTAITIAARVLNLLEAEAFPPARLLPSSEGGIAISFVRGNVRAGMEIYNTGEIAAATYTQQAQPTVWELESSEAAIRKAIEQIRVHFTA